MHPSSDPQVIFATICGYFLVSYICTRLLKLAFRDRLKKVDPVLYTELEAIFKWKRAQERLGKKLSGVLIDVTVGPLLGLVGLTTPLDLILPFARDYVRRESKLMPK